MGESEGHFLGGRLILVGPDDCGQHHPWAGGPGLYKQAEKTAESKPVSTVPPRPLLLFLPPGSCLTSSRASLKDAQSLRSASQINPSLRKSNVVGVSSQQQKADEDSDQSQGKLGTIAFLLWPHFG